LAFRNVAGGHVSNFLERLRSGQTGSQPQTEPAPETTRELVDINRWDRRRWQEVRKTTPIDDAITDLSLGDQHKGGEREGFANASELSEGLFFELYKASPQLRDQRSLQRDLYPAHRILEEVADHPELQKLHDMTMGDTVLSTMAFTAMADELRAILGRIPPPPPPPAPGGGQQQGEGGDQEPQDGDGQQDGEEPQAGGGIDEQAEADWEQMYDDLLADLDIGRAAHRAVHRAAEEAEELEDLRHGIGLEDGEWLTMSPEERLAMAERLRTDEMRELAKVIGRTKRFALGVRATRVIDVPHEAYDVTLGNNLKHTLQSQFALLGTPETRYEFYRRYLDKELLQFKLRGHEEVGKGPVVVAIDKSGTMNGAPFVWAMGVAEAMRRLAAEESRDYHGIFFGNNAQRERFDFPKGKGPFEKVLTFLSVAANGGTQFDGVLTEALEKASTAFDDDNRGKADILFITDGRAELTEDWIANFNRERQRTGVRVYSVYINGSTDMTGKTGPEKLLAKISNIVIPVRELTPQAVTDVFARV